jgi:hypothetical protein
VAKGRKRRGPVHGHGFCAGQGRHGSNISVDEPSAIQPTGKADCQLMPLASRCKWSWTAYLFTVAADWALRSPSHGRLGIRDLYSGSVADRQVSSAGQSRCVLL